MTHGQSELDEKIRAYYELDGEHVRLTTRSVGGRVEFERVRRLASQRLAPGSRVLDVGGATGVHSRWLAAAGHEVTLVDPVASQVTAAAAVGTFEAVVGDARALPVPDGQADAVLLFGPLYHLAGRADRLQALDEARRALRPGGVLFAQGIGRIVAFVDSAVHGGSFDELGDEDLAILRTGRWTNPGEGFPGGHFHTAQELHDEVADAGFDEIEVRGLEGPNVGALEMVRDDEQLVETAIDLAERFEARLAATGRPLSAGADYSPHLLATAVRGGKD